MLRTHFVHLRGEWSAGACMLTYCVGQGATSRNGMEEFSRGILLFSYIVLVKL